MDNIRYEYNKYVIFIVKKRFHIKKLTFSMESRLLYLLCTTLGTVIFGLIFFNYYLGAKEEEAEKKEGKKKNQ